MLAIDGERSDMHVSVIIPHFDHNAIIWDSVRVILAEAVAVPLEVIVIDDESPNPLIAPDDLLCDGRLTVIRVVHGGPAHARRAGGEVSRGDLLVFTDADCRAHLGWLAAIVTAASENPEAAGFTGPLVDATREAGTFDVLHGFMRSISELDHAAQEFEYAGQVMVGTIGANFAIRRDWYQRAGGFDDSFRYPGGEDYDLGFRVQRDAGRIIFVADAVVHHVYPTETRLLIKRWIGYGKGKVRFATKHDIDFAALHIVCRRWRDLFFRFPEVVSMASRHFSQHKGKGAIRDLTIIFVEILFQIGAILEIKTLETGPPVSKR